MRRRSYRWVVVLSGFVILESTGCSVKQQQDVLAGVGAFIPGSRNAMIYPESSNSEPQGNGLTATTQAVTGSTATATISPTPLPPPAPRNDLGVTDAQLVLQTMQRAMRDNPKPFIECLDESACRRALTTHLIRLQKLAGGTLELPAVYERYDLKRGKE